MAKLVSKTYGDALFEVAKESGQLENFWKQCEAIKVALQENPELFRLMGHPKIGKEEKRKIIEDIFTDRVLAEIVGLLCMLADKGHFEEAGAVLDYFIARVKEYSHIGTASVTTAMELSRAKKKAVDKQLLELTGYKKFEIQYAVETALIGGMVIRIGDRVVDSSVRTKLNDLTRELLK